MSPKNDNKKSSYLAPNLKSLRLRHDMTLEDIAKRLDLKGKTSYRAYEKELAVPSISVLMKIASVFDVSLDELIYHDLTQEIKDNKVKSLHPVEVIPVKARAGYQTGYPDAEYINGLQKISIPYKPYGLARAFEIDGNSMEPDVKDGSYVVGIKVDRNEFVSGKRYVIVSKDGIAFKIVHEDEDQLQMISANPASRPYSINKEDVYEVWKYFCQLNKPGES